jgi:hypothetical protein
MMTIKAEFTAGTSIEEAEKDALAFANNNHVWVSFDFNGVKCNVRPCGSHSSCLSFQYYECNKEKGASIFN